MKKTLDEETLKEYKTALNRMYFEPNCLKAFNNYAYSAHWNPLIQKNDFCNKYNQLQDLIGGSKEYQDKIFLIESYWELKVLQEMIARGYDVRNVYDCFYFKSSQTTVEEVKAIIEKAIFNIGAK